MDDAKKPNYQLTIEFRNNAGVMFSRCPVILSIGYNVPIQLQNSEFSNISLVANGK